MAEQCGDGHPCKKLRVMTDEVTHTHTIGQSLDVIEDSLQQTDQRELTLPVLNPDQSRERTGVSFSYPAKNAGGISDTKCANNLYNVLNSGDSIADSGDNGLKFKDSIAQSTSRSGETSSESRIVHSETGEEEIIPCKSGTSGENSCIKRKETQCQMYKESVKAGKTKSISRLKQNDPTSLPDLVRETTIDCVEEDDMNEILQSYLSAFREESMDQKQHESCDESKRHTDLPFKEQRLSAVGLISDNDDPSNLVSTRTERPSAVTNLFGENDTQSDIASSRTEDEKYVREGSALRHREVELRDSGFIEMFSNSVMSRLINLHHINSDESAVYRTSNCRKSSPVNRSSTERFSTDTVTDIRDNVNARRDATNVFASCDSATAGASVLPSRNSRECVMTGRTGTYSDGKTLRTGAGRVAASATVSTSRNSQECLQTGRTWAYGDGENSRTGRSCGRAGQGTETNCNSSATSCSDGCALMELAGGTEKNNSGPCHGRKSAWDSTNSVTCVESGFMLGNDSMPAEMDRAVQKGLSYNQPATVAESHSRSSFCVKEFSYSTGNKNGPMRYEAKLTIDTKGTTIEGIDPEQWVSNNSRECDGEHDRDSDSISGWYNLEDDLSSIKPTNKCFALSLEYRNAVTSVGNINMLPETVLLQIFHELTPYTLLRQVSCVCKYWYNLCRDPSLWRVLSMRDQHRLTDTILLQILSFSDRVLKVNLTDCRFITDAGIREVLSKCQHLQSLSLMRCFDITDKAFEGLNRSLHCSKLQSLHLDDCCKISDEAIMQVADSCPELRSLHLNQCNKVTDGSISKMADRCPRLSQLLLDHCIMVTDIGLAAVVRNCPRLSYLNIMSCGITDDGLKLFSNLSDLTILDVSNILRLTSDSVKFVSRHCRKLECVNLSLNSVMDDNCVTELARNLPDLKRLYCVSCNISDRGLENIAALRPTITSLDVGWCQEITDHGVRVISEACHSLDYFGLIRCDHVTLETMEELVNKFPGVNYSTFLYESRRLLERARHEGFNFCFETIAFKQ